MTKLLAVACLAACGGGSATSSDLGVADLAPFGSTCGAPGETGNSKGVGKFCMDSGDCRGQTASICSAITNDAAHPELNTFFCTIAGNANCMPAVDCGENALCRCDDRGCGCAPLRCTDGGT